MAGHKKWDGTLNVGGVIGGLAFAGLCVAFVMMSVDLADPPRWAYKLPIGGAIAGAFLGTVGWSRWRGEEKA